MATENTGSDAERFYEQEFDECPICCSTESCQCCQECGAETLADCHCCSRCRGTGETALLSGIEWNYIGSDYGECPECRGTGRR